MRLLGLPMGCLSSRSTIAPTPDQSGPKTVTNINQQPTMAKASPNGLGTTNTNTDGDEIEREVDRGGGVKRPIGADLSVDAAEDNIMSMMMDGNQPQRLPKPPPPLGKGSKVARDGDDRKRSNNIDENDDEEEDEEEEENDEGEEESLSKKDGDGLLDEPANMELLRQYMAVDYEINLLEDKDILRVYHEKIEQLEQLERELDMIGSEVEEVATRGDSEDAAKRIANGDNLGENNSMMSGATGSLASVSRGRASKNGGRSLKSTTQTTRPGGGASNSNSNSRKQAASSNNDKSLAAASGQGSSSIRQIQNNLSYTTVEEVFNRKIILEKERDKLKKEVEMVIVECDKLQQRYKRRDEILDKLFDGRTGNGLENHLEQQLNWLLEQKHYVDQVFYVWKRAETITSQTCEQFASALDLLKRLTKVEEPEERAELVKTIGDLLVKSRQGMEQAQKYNPNVDAPFFTNNETERFDKIIEKISSNSVSQSEYSQILTVIQFAYKRAVSIRLWLEQILQTTIARDSFELAEEYKWIAIQLRKERINLIKSKLQYSPYRSMAQSIQEQIVRQQSATGQARDGQVGDGVEGANLADMKRQQNEINRDSGIESEANDVDIEEEIYRLLELNRSRLQGAGGGGSEQAIIGPKSDQQMQEWVEKRIKGERPLQLAELGTAAPPRPPSTSTEKLTAAEETNIAQQGQQPHQQHQQQQQHQHQGQHEKGKQEVRTTFDGPVASAIAPDALRTSAHPSESSANISIGTPSRLKVELDEEAKQSLLKQVDQIHSEHKSRIERLRGSNRAKATSSIMIRMREARGGQQQQGQQQQQAQPPHRPHQHQQGPNEET